MEMIWRLVVVVLYHLFFYKVIHEKRVYVLRLRVESTSHDGTKTFGDMSSSIQLDVLVLLVTHVVSVAFDPRYIEIVETFE